MTIVRSGWLDGRPFSRAYDVETGDEKLVCMKCWAEYAERDQFIGHNCEPGRDREPGPGVDPSTHPARRQPSPWTYHGIRFASPEAEELAKGHPVRPSLIRRSEPSGKEGYTKPDIQALVESMASAQDDDTSEEEEE